MRNILQETSVLSVTHVVNFLIFPSI